MNRVEPLLTVTDLAVTYSRAGRRFWVKSKRHSAVREATFEVQTGETFGLVGETGSGKTTVAMSILRFVRPDRGHILFKGVNLWTLSGQRLRKTRRRIQPVFQNAGQSLNPWMTVAEAVGDGLADGEQADKNQRTGVVVNLLKAVDLGPEHLHRYPHQLSTGQKQRVCLARALAPEPDLLVLDEPLSGQDVSIQAHLIHLLARLREEQGLTYLLISHDLRVIRSLADRVAVMHDGTLEEQPRGP